MRFARILISLLTLALLLTGLPIAAQTIYEEYEEGSISFDWSSWPFGFPSGSVALEGPVWNDDLTFPGGADQGCGGGLSGVPADTTQAVAIGGLINGDGSYDGVAVFVSFPEGPAIGTYAVDTENNTAGFIYIEGCTNLTIPDQEEDLLAWFEGLEAEHRYGSTSGTITVTAVGNDGFEGTFSGLMGDPDTFTLISVESGAFSVADVPVASVPEANSRAQLSAAPNPFNPQTTVKLTLDRPERVTVAVHDMAGRKVALLHQGSLDDGPHTWTWNGTDTLGRPQSAGMYFCRAAGQGWAETTKLVLIP